MKGFDLPSRLGVPELEVHLAAVQQLLLDSLPPKSSALYEPIQRILTAPSKQLRAGLVLACASPAPITSKVIRAATAIELVHLGTLVHDDIMDEATTRRGTPTVNHVEGVSIAILVGDFLFAAALAHAMSAGSTVGKQVALTIQQLCSGQASELVATGDIHRTKQAYIETIKHKTGALLRAACQVGAVSAGKSRKQAVAFGTFGENFGMAFQLLDDVLDVISTPELLGKPTAADKQAGVYTLPVILALAQNPTLELKDITAEYLLRIGAIETTIETARTYTAQAAAALVLPDMEALSSLPDEYLKWTLTTLIDPRYRTKIVAYIEAK